MALQDVDWYGRNADRLYPLDDVATGRDDAGNLLPNNILVDAAVRFPSTAGNYVCLSAVTVTPKLVTVVLQAATGILKYTAALAPPAGPAYTVLASVSLPQPVEPYVSYALDPILAGAGGWLVFGPGVNYPYQGKFSTAAQGALLPRCASAYTNPLITGVGRPFCANPLVNLVALNAGNDLYAKVEERFINGVNVEAIVIGLSPNATHDPYAKYNGPCGKRPESGTCTPPGITQINTTHPDWNGNINITWKGIRAYPLATGHGGVALTMPYALSDVCPSRTATLPDPATGALPDTGNDNCVNAPPVFSSQAAPPLAQMAGPPPASTSITFDGAPNPLRVVSGLFSAGRSGYAAEAVETPNLSTLPLEGAPRRLTLALELPGNSPTAAGVLLDYQDNDNYLMALVDSLTQALELWTVTAGRQQISRAPLAVLESGTVQLDVRLGRSDALLQVAAQARGAAVGALTWRGISTPGRAGVAALGGRALFRRLDWEI